MYCPRSFRNSKEPTFTQKLNTNKTSNTGRQQEQGRKLILYHQVSANLLRASGRGNGIGWQTSIFLGVSRINPTDFSFLWQCVCVCVVVFYTLKHRSHKTLHIHILYFKLLVSTASKVRLFAKVTGESSVQSLRCC